jgi:hypothetical protein
MARVMNSCARIAKNRTPQRAVGLITPAASDGLVSETPHT